MGSSAARRVLLASPYPATPAFVLAPRGPSSPSPEGHPRVTRHPSSGAAARPCADQTNFTRLSPGVGCRFRALGSLTLSLSLSLAPSPSLHLCLTLPSRSSQLLPLPPAALPFAVFLLLARSSSIPVSPASSIPLSTLPTSSRALSLLPPRLTEPGDSVAKFLEGLNSMLRTRAVKYT